MEVGAWARIRSFTVANIRLVKSSLFSLIYGKEVFLWKQSSKPLPVLIMLNRYYLLTPHVNHYFFSLVSSTLEFLITGFITPQSYCSP